MRVISGRFGGRRLDTTEGPGYRPATGRVREAVFSMLEARLGGFAGLAALDVFAGSGSLGIEALSRGAALVWFVESARKAAGLIAKNLRDLGAAPGAWKVLCEDAAKALARRPPRPFDLVFADPPYGHDLLGPALQRLVAGGWLAEGGLALCEVEAAVTAESLADAARPLTLETDRLYGQTRILLWRN
ncbi:MAG: 16S rRNA (guanine(966)-N(2))-methyltransferase RsmD [Desulfovibrionaceae bacterium]